MFTFVGHPGWNQPHCKGSKHKWRLATALGLEVVGQVVGASESREGTENREKKGVGTGENAPPRPEPSTLRIPMGKQASPDPDMTLNQKGHGRGRMGLQWGLRKLPGSL